MALAASKSEQPELQNISDLLETISTSLTATGTSLPSSKVDTSDVSILPPQDGISLLDTKCDLLLSYLQNLVFLTLLQLRELPSQNSLREENGDTDSTQSLRTQVTDKLIELRTYLDRGVRPLEGRLKYQVDKVIKAAEAVERSEKGAQPANARTPAHEAGSGSEDDSASEDGSSEDEDESEEGEDIDEMAYRPNVSAFAKKINSEAKVDKPDRKATSDGIYRPPKIMPTAMPTTERKERKERPTRRSNVIDEFVSAEMSSAPMAEPSIGSTIVSGGRHTKTRKERAHEAERTRYEETHFIRLAKESKKEQAKKAASLRREGTFGGEEWKGLTEGADRITRLTQRAKGSGSALERSRKRKLTEDGQRGDGVGVGQIFEKRRKKVDSWKKQ
ncbi:Sas10/Utp3/C1D family-domain-containing protein [Aspergillus pseudoustus]|uniref:Sas10/Utp3/C1D family-domain-containing protein n=1 Tax=Aspergillus pseudoustus TaxID=1810923 RepID=A0ABR4JCK8_9EURO